MYRHKKQLEIGLKIPTKLQRRDPRSQNIDFRAARKEEQQQGVREAPVSPQDAVAPRPPAAAALWGHGHRRPAPGGQPHWPRQRDEFQAGHLSADYSQKLSKEFEKPEFNVSVPSSQKATCGHPGVWPKHMQEAAGIRKSSLLTFLAWWFEWTSQASAGPLIGEEAREVARRQEGAPPQQSARRDRTPCKNFFWKTFSSCK
ncbi:cortistatin isoform X1 [Macaca fascicularis]|uniref:cortistatin isoform X1 n=1 Tax=Macaca fascicularis TaxID=9541 RepID=UPI0032B087D6